MKEKLTAWAGLILFFPITYFVIYLAYGYVGPCPKSAFLAPNLDFLCGGSTSEPQFWILLGIAASFIALEVFFLYKAVAKRGFK